VSFTTRDLRCTRTPDALPPEAHYEVSVLYRVSDGPPPCPECGAARVPFYATHEMSAPAVHTFKEFVVDGEVRITSPEGAQRYREHLARTKGVPTEAIQFNSRGNVKQTVEELKHRAIVKRKESGFDERTFAAYKTERNRINAEQKARRN
jgi:hypothetical protein